MEETNIEAFTNSTDPVKEDTEFKKPILVGKVGRLPKKIQKANPNIQDVVPVAVHSSFEDPELELDPDDNNSDKTTCLSDIQIDKPSTPPYQEPSWSSLPQSRGRAYVLEVLKSGLILNEINLMNKAFWIFGRSTTCDVPLAHPATSRYHAVLQYRGEEAENFPVGFYIYDLASTHGTYLNKRHLKPYTYAPVRVGHIIKFGFSTRSFLLTGPEEDAEEESKFTLTELKQKRAEKLLQKEISEKEALIKEQHEVEELRKKEEERGVDWGLGEDAEEDPDLAENPYAQTNNEEIYIEDPKKALRGFMEREGFTLDYDCTEHGFGQFLCKVELPLDDEHGHPIIAEVLHKGKKKEAVVQCALEACRILDRHGVLRQAIHESRKRKAKDWEENDFYDSDDDTFLDRTGTIEKKREKRMNSKLSQQPETYQSLLEKEKKIKVEILKIKKELSTARLKNENQYNSIDNEDALDSYMKELNQSKLSKQSISKLKSSLVQLQSDLSMVVKLISLAKPTDLPQLIIDKPLETTVPSVKKNLPIIGKRSKTKLQLPLKPADTQPISTLQNYDKEEEDEEDDNAVLNKIGNRSTEDSSLTENFKISDQKLKNHEGNFLTEEQKHNEENTTNKIKIALPQTPNSDNDEDDSLDDKELTLEELKKRQKRNQRRIKQRQDKAEIKKQKGYEEDAHKKDYNMWIPPSNQIGDGRTELNAKFGY